MIFLTIEQIVELHVMVIKSYGGSTGIRDLGRLESVVATQTQTAFGEDIYPDVFAKTAAIIRNIIGHHPFVDGNKRTAMLSGLTLLEINEYTTKIPKGELEDFAVRVAVEHLEIADIAKWLEKYSSK